MLKFESQAIGRGWVAIAVLLPLVGCGGSSTPPTPAAPAVQAASGGTSSDALQKENARLKAEVDALTAKVADLGQTPQALLERVQERVKAEKLDEAKAEAAKLVQRYGPDGQAKIANAAVAQLEAKLEARQALARQLEARGFYALAPTKAAAVNGFLIKVESIALANRWVFNTHDYQYNYRDVQRGEKFVLLKTTLQSTDRSRDPDLPEIGIYAIDGKEMRHLASMDYEFRKWTSYGSYIGLHHDFKNDFAHSSAIPFTAAASIDEDAAKEPFAVVATGSLCHSRGEQIGQPEVVYRRDSSCNYKNVLSPEDFNSGPYKVLAVFNRPKGR